MIGPEETYGANGNGALIVQDVREGKPTAT
jgi:hypothetical protein